MTCPSCAHENRPGARFCEECAAPLARVCTSCGAELRPTAKFCDECATPVAGSVSAARPAEPADSRKVVTIVFADLAGSTAMQERLDAESVRRFMESYYQAMRDAVESHGGTVTQFLGDGVKAVFGIPRVAEDDAIRAVRAGVAMQKSFRALADEQRGAVGATGLRVAVNTGEVVANDETEIIGDPVNVAARLQEQGQDGDVVVGESTRQLVSALVTLELLGKFALKGRSEAVEAYRVVSLDRPAGAAAAPFVGREEELARLAAVYDTAVENPAAGLTVLVGSPGLGKSRLIDEFAHRHADVATVVHAHCDAEGGASFAPLAVAIRELLGIEGGADADMLRATVEAAMPGEDSDRARIASGIAALLAGSPASPEETFFVVRRMLAALAQTKPVVLVIDDLQWAESLLLDLVEHLIQWGSGTPLFVLIGSRPELRELRSSLVTPGGLVSEVITLSGLDAGAAMRLASSVIGATDLPAAIAAKVLATSEGNPLFVSELVRMLVQEGALTKEGERWTVGANLAALEMPPTIHALLAARIERLRPEERALLERAAVVGRNFSRNAVAALLPHEADDLDARLEALQRSELIERDTGWLLGEPALRFHHVLIRDAAYRRLLKGTRAELHAKLADWIEAQVGDAPEHDETIGWHLEQSHAFLCELGPIDANAKRLGERAAMRLSAAGRRALAGDDLPLAASLLGRAIERLDSEDPARADLALDWCEALLSAGEVGLASTAIAELGRFTAESDRLRAWQSCFASQLTVLTAPQELQAAADAVAEAAQQLTELGDAAGEAKAHSVHAQALARLGKVGACEAALDLALAAARRAGDRRRANAVLAGAPLAALWGPSPVTRASGRCLDVVRVLRITQGAPAVESVALSCQGVLEALRGRTDAARRMIASSRKMVEELGIANRLFEADVFAARIEAMEGDSAAAERLLRGAYDGLRDLGLGIDAAIAGSLLAQTLLAQDRVAEAEALSHESEALAGDDLQAAIAWRGVRAEALAKRGEHAAAIEFAKAAVAIASATDALLYHADARMALAAALRAAGRNAEAEAEERRAIDIWEAKGATLLVERAREGELHSTDVGNESIQPVAAALARRRPIRPNEASAVHARSETAFAARDFAGWASFLSEDFAIIDHPTGSTYGRDAARASFERGMRANDVIRKIEPLATLGESLFLYRRHFSASGSVSRNFDVGAYEIEAIAIRELDDRGRFRVQEDFAHDRLGEAISCLYERHADLLPEGPERERAEATARSVGVVAPGGFDLDRYAEVFRSDGEIVDHRLLGSGSATGPDSLFLMMAQTREVGDDVESRGQDVLALSHDALLMSWLTSGVGRESGGEFEWAFIRLFVFDHEGRVARYELFDEGCEAEALARFDELVAGTKPKPSERRPVRANAASVAGTRMAAAVTTRDLDALETILGEHLKATDHRWHTSYGRDGVLETCRRFMQPQDADFCSKPIATLGEWLSLGRDSISASGASAGHFDVGEHATEFLHLFEVDRSGRIQRLEFFASDRLTDAVMRLYECHAELLPEGPERLRAAATARAVAVWCGPIDVDRLATAISPSVENIDHRKFGTWSARGAEEFLQHWREQLELTIGFAHRAEVILAIASNVFLSRRTYFGTGRDTGGIFENVVLALWVFDSDGLLTSVEVWEPEDEAAALARFDAVVGNRESEPAPERFENAASRAVRRLFDHFNSRNWVGIEALAAPELVFDERRRMLHNTCGREIWLEQFRVMFDVPESHFKTQLLATRGERLSLSLHQFAGMVADGGGPLEMDDHFVLHEVDGVGRIVAIVLFDLENKEAAYAELDAHFQAGEGVEHSAELAWLRDFDTALASRDWGAMAACYAAAFVGEDHRLVGWGTLHGPAAFLVTLQELVALAPDVRLRWDHLRISQRAMLAESTWVGTRDGGAFENQWVAVLEFNAQGQSRRIDFYDPHHLDRAIARYDEVSAGPPADPLAEFAKPNAASKWPHRFQPAFNARDWDAVDALFAEDGIYEDRQRHSLVHGGLDMALTSIRDRADAGARLEHIQLLGTAGSRFAIHNLLWAGGGAGDRFEMELIIVQEVDETGRLVATINFAPDDKAAAREELFERWVASGADGTPAALIEFLSAVNDHNLDRVRAVLPGDFVIDDHRRTGFGRLEGPDAYIPALSAAFELSPDARWDTLYRVAEGPHSSVNVILMWGANTEGGEFESPFVAFFRFRGEQLQAAEMFEIDALDEALARFQAMGEELTS